MSAVSVKVLSLYPIEITSNPQKKSGKSVPDQDSTLDFQEF
jgi:hypothetical protein